MLSPDTAKALRNVLKINSKSKRLGQAIHIVQYEGGVSRHDIEPAYDMLSRLDSQLASSPIVKAANEVAKGKD